MRQPPSTPLMNGFAWFMTLHQDEVTRAIESIESWEFHLLLVSPNPALKALRPPYPGAKTLKLDDLTVIYKKIHAKGRNS